MHVRRLTESDAEEYRTLRLEGLKGAPTAFGSSYEESERRPLSAYAERLRSGEGAAVFGAFGPGGLAGTVGVYRDTGLKERHKAVLWGMYVTPATRRTGVARRLVGAALDAVRGMEGVLQVKLAVEGSNAPARALYESFGFEEYGREERALFVGGRYYAEVHMVLFLDRPGSASAGMVSASYSHDE